MLWTSLGVLNTSPAPYVTRRWIKSKNQVPFDDEVLNRSLDNLMFRYYLQIFDLLLAEPSFMSLIFALCVRVAMRSSLASWRNDWRRCTIRRLERSETWFWLVLLLLPTIPGDSPIIRPTSHTYAPATTALTMWLYYNNYMVCRLVQLYQISALNFPLKCPVIRTLCCDIHRRFRLIVDCIYTTKLR